MIRLLFKAMALAVKAAVMIFIVFLASTSKAGDERLQALATGDDSRGWEAVGRLEIGGFGFCTGALIAPDLVLTAAHCLFDKRNGAQVRLDEIEFRAGWRHGRATAYRQIRRVALHPAFGSETGSDADRLSSDIALLELAQPVRNTTVVPFSSVTRLKPNDKVAVVSYAQGREEAPALQPSCAVQGMAQGVFVFSCDVDFGSSGAPVFQLVDGRAEIVSVVVAKSEMDGRKVAIGAGVEGVVAQLQTALTEPRKVIINRMGSGEDRMRTGAKFVRADGG